MHCFFVCLSNGLIELFLRHPNHKRTINNHRWQTKEATWVVIIIKHKIPSLHLSHRACIFKRNLHTKRSSLLFPLSGASRRRVYSSALSTKKRMIKVARGERSEKFVPRAHAALGSCGGINFRLLKLYKQAYAPLRLKMECLRMQIRKDRWEDKLAFNVQILMASTWASEVWKEKGSTCKFAPSLSNLSVELVQIVRKHSNNVGIMRL